MSQADVTGKATKWARHGFMTVVVLPSLVGRPCDEVAYALVSGLRPSRVRVVNGACSDDACLWRVTITVDDNNIIESVEQEVEVGLPPGVFNGNALRARLT